MLVTLPAYAEKPCFNLLQEMVTAALLPGTEPAVMDCCKKEERMGSDVTGQDGDASLEV